MRATALLADHRFRKDTRIPGFELLPEPEPEPEPEHEEEPQLEPEPPNARNAFGRPLGGSACPPVYCSPRPTAEAVSAWLNSEHARRATMLPRRRSVTGDAIKAG